MTVIEMREGSEVEWGGSDRDYWGSVGESGGTVGGVMEMIKAGWGARRATVMCCVYSLGLFRETISEINQRKRGEAGEARPINNRSSQRVSRHQLTH